MGGEIQNFTGTPKYNIPQKVNIFAKCLIFKLNE